jgi:uncharacterized membrane protein
MNAYGAVLLLFSLVLAPAVSGAIIHGSVYDLELNTLSQAVIEINTVPRQVMVSRNGTYAFTVSPGQYIITARQARLGLLTQENITVQQEGSYVLDLLLFPDLDAEDELLNETLDVDDYDEPVIEQAGIGRIVIGLAILAVFAAVGWYYFNRRKPEGKEAKHEAAEEPHAKPASEEKRPAKADLAEILAFVRSEGGRTTQKDLRRAIPYSEAKISLMIAELESQGKLKKIKKGRGNIIILL